MYLFLFLSLFFVRIINACKCSYNLGEFTNCGPKIIVIKEKPDISTNILWAGILSLLKKMPDFEFPTKIDNSKLPVIDDNSKLPEHDTDETSIHDTDHTSVHDIELPQFDTIAEMEEIIIHGPDTDKMNLDLRNSWTEWLKLVDEMNNERAIENLKDDAFWFEVIDNPNKYDFKIDWEQLPNYQQMTHIYRQMLYFKKMLETIPTDAYLEYEYMDDVRETYDIVPVNNERDIVINRLNEIRQTFIAMYNDFTRANTIDSAKTIYYRWETYIQNRFRDDAFFMYQTKTSRYLAMLFAQWINRYYPQGSGLPPGLPKAVAGKARQHESDEENKRPKQRPKIEK